jgi:FMNH2-dependent dimethyl sulfone monooxygenase
MVPTSVGANADAATLDSPLFRSENKLKLAVFGFNNTRGLSLSAGQGTIAKLDWPQQLRIARAAEAAGIEAVISAARWRGYPGPAGCNSEQYDVVPWAAALAASTERLLFFSTIHVPLLHPLRVAKDLATIDHISSGRACLNIVAGWHDELEMFGIVQLPHDDRYEVAAEWTEFVKQLWDADESFDFDGTHFHGTGAVSLPKPIQRPRPPIMSAGSSKAGRAFAAEHADVCFVASVDGIEAVADAAADVKAQARAHGREVSVWTNVGLVIADTEADAQRRYDYFVHETGDWVAAQDIMRIVLGGDVQSMLEPVQSRALSERAIAWQFAHPLLGPPDQIVAQMQVLVDAGIDGLAMVFFDYERGLEQFRQQVLPRAVAVGLRSELRG